MNVFDFDNTIYDGESALDFFKFYLKKDRSLLKNIPDVCIALLKYKQGKMSVEDALSMYGKQVTEYFKKNMTPELLKTDTEKFWNIHAKNIKPWYFDIRTPDDVIITCSPDFSMKEICKRLKIKKYISTVMDTKTGEITRLCFRENKVKAFFEEFPDGKIENFYTDSVNDKPLMDISENVYLVKKDKITKIK